MRETCNEEKETEETSCAITREECSKKVIKYLGRSENVINDEEKPEVAVDARKLFSEKESQETSYAITREEC